MNPTTLATPAPENNPANIHTVEKASGSVDYRANLRALVRAFFNGDLLPFQFENSFRIAVNNGLTRAWNEGAEQVGIYPSEFTEEEKQRLITILFEETSHISGFVSAISRVQRRKRSALGALLSRTEMWALRYGAIRSLAMSIFGQNRKLKWVMDPFKEHCHACLALNGRVYRASTWRRYNLYPRKRTLACRGYRCGCRFEPTTDRATPGRPPQVA